MTSTDIPKDLVAYAAYGVNVNPLVLRQRLGPVTTLGVGFVKDRTVRFVGHSVGWGGAVATLEKAPGDQVFVVVHLLTQQQLAILDGYEGVLQGKYHQALLTVETGDGPVRCITYLAAATEQGAPSKQYVDTISQGQRLWGHYRIDE